MLQKFWLVIAHAIPPASSFVLEVESVCVIPLLHYNFYSKCSATILSAPRLRYLIASFGLCLIARFNQSFVAYIVGYHLIGQHLNVQMVWKSCCTMLYSLLLHGNLDFLLASLSESYTPLESSL